MKPSVLRFGASGETYVHPVIAAAIAIVVIAMLCVRRRHIIGPFLAGVFLVPMDEVLVVGSLHFQMLRLLILAGWVRIAMEIARSRDTNIRWNAIDTCILVWAVSTAVDIVLLWNEWSAVVNQLGALYSICGIYFMGRVLIRDEEDVTIVVKVLAYLSAVIAVIMTIEQATGTNPYVIFGGVQEALRASLMARDDHFRAMAAFGHPILAGTFGGILVPLFVGAWWKSRQNRLWAACGVLSCTIIVVASNSSTSVLAYGAGIFGLAMWRLRDRMRTIRWGIVIALVTLHLAMKAPVWALIARVDITGGSSAYHRYFLVDQFIRHFSDWWLIGTKDYPNWGWDMWDLANQYVSVGETAGLAPFVAFLGLIIFGFKYVGTARKRWVGRPYTERFLWAIGSSLFANVVAFFGIAYYDQTSVAWYVLLASISAVAAPAAVEIAQAEKAEISSEFVAVAEVSPDDRLSPQGSCTADFTTGNCGKWASV